ncbi:hypothetical protein F5Y16DRAFT_415297 [Xylariaceae sp. FL0255]|nr:hypothetical protein F5Y16DRAFT_415297 [Xylariaceae sp. FL0255]
MCYGIKIKKACGHIELKISVPCGRKCQNPQGPLTKEDTFCARCRDEEASKKESKAVKKEKDEKKAARAAELMNQFLGEGHEERMGALTQRMNELHASTRRGVVEARMMLEGGTLPSPSRPRSTHAPLYPRTFRASLSDPDSSDNNTRSHHSQRDYDRKLVFDAVYSSESDSDEEDGRRDVCYLMDDGQTVMQRRYHIINGHHALIGTRSNIKDVEPLVRVEVLEKRERQIARKEEKKRRRKEGEKTEKKKTESKEVEQKMKKAEKVPSVVETKKRSVSGEKAHRKSRTGPDPVSTDASVMTKVLIDDENEPLLTHLSRSHEHRNTTEAEGNMTPVSYSPWEVMPEAALTGASFSERMHKEHLNRARSDTVIEHPASRQKAHKEEKLAAEKPREHREHHKTSTSQKDAGETQKSRKRSDTVIEHQPSDKTRQSKSSKNHTREEQEKKEDGVIAESSKAPHQRQLHDKSVNGQEIPWAERFADDISYDEDSEGATADSDATIKPAKSQSQSQSQSHPQRRRRYHHYRSDAVDESKYLMSGTICTGKGKKVYAEVCEEVCAKVEGKEGEEEQEEEEELDVWSQIAELDDKGEDGKEGPKRKARRASAAAAVRRVRFE